MRVERKEFKSLAIDIENNQYLLNGEQMNGISRLDVEFDNGKWTLFVTKDEFYEQTAPDSVIEKVKRMVGLLDEANRLAGLLQETNQFVKLLQEASQTIDSLSNEKGKMEGKEK